MSHPFIKGTLFALLLAVGVKPSAPPWQPPKSDWFYVLDLDQSTAPEKSHILVVDPPEGVRGRRASRIGLSDGLRPI